MSDRRSTSPKHVHRSLRLLLAASAALAVGLVATASADMWGTTDAPTSADRAAKRTKLTLKDSPHGRVIFANGYAMYVFTKDEGSKSRCYGKCAVAWPPLELKGKIVAGAGVRKQLIGTTKRRNGDRQITYKGQPLYGYIDDPRGRVLCHDVEEFGGTWYAVQRSGKPAP